MDRQSLQNRGTPTTDPGVHPVRGLWPGRLAGQSVQRNQCSQSVLDWWATQPVATDSIAGACVALPVGRHRSGPSCSRTLGTKPRACVGVVPRALSSDTTGDSRIARALTTGTAELLLGNHQIRNVGALLPSKACRLGALRLSHLNLLRVHLRRDVQSVSRADAVPKVLAATDSSVSPTLQPATDTRRQTERIFEIPIQTKMTGAPSRLGDRSPPFITQPC